MKINVVSFNVQHFENFNTEEIDFDAYADAIKAFDADIVGLNEVRGAGDYPGYTAQAETIAKRLGYYYYFAEAIKFGGKNPYGNAIISRYPILSAETILIPDPVKKAYNGYYETRCILKAKIDIDGGLDVYVTHFGLNRDEHINCAATVCNNVGGRCILMGDFNVTPESDILIPIRNILKDTADEKSEMFSFPSDAPDRKIDYMFTGEGIKCISSEIIPVIVSDHRPYSAVLELL